MRAATLERCADAVEAAGAAMAERFAGGGRLFTFGNGGSATDAQGSAELFRHPPSGRPLPALSLVEDQAVLTALSNDVGFELVFSRQLIAHAVAATSPSVSPPAATRRTCYAPSMRRHAAASSPSGCAATRDPGWR